MPATLPWPKIPKQPAKNRCRSPSRSTYCCSRNRTSAWATVSRRCCSAISHLPDRRRPIRQARVDLLVGPCLPDPTVRRIVADLPDPLGAGSGHHIEVVHVVAGHRHRGTVPAVWDQNDVAGTNLGEDLDLVARGTGDALVADPGLASPVGDIEVVDLLQHALAGPVLVVLVRRIGRPVAGRRDHLAGDQLVGVEGLRRGEVVDLPTG